MISKLVALALRPFLFLVYALGALVPRNRRLWAFGSWSGTRFADNAKWLFLHASREVPEVRCVWISRSPQIVAHVRSLGLEAYSIRSWRGVWIALRAGIYVFDVGVWDICFWASARARRVNLWHGIPLKQIERDILLPHHPAYPRFRGPLWRRVLERLRAPWLMQRPHLLASTSPHVSGRMGSAFGVGPERIVEGGLPRNDALLGAWRPEETGDEEIVGKVRALKSQGKRVACYLPTFRDTAGPDARIPIDWAQLNEFLEGRGWVLLLKLHANDQAKLPDLAAYPALQGVPAAADPYAMLRECDLLLSDYSSIFFDFVLLNRPIIHYVYDLDKYQASDRGFYDPFEEAAPGLIATDMSGLLAAWERADREVSGAGDEDASQRRARVRSRDHRYVDGNACPRTIEAIRQRWG